MKAWRYENGSYRLGSSWKVPSELRTFVTLGICSRDDERRTCVDDSGGAFDVVSFLLGRSAVAKRFFQERSGE